MKKLTIITMLLLLTGAVSLHAKKDKDRKLNAYAIGFYNLENLFDTQHDEGKNDFEYLPDGRNKWSEMKYQHKLRNMARVLSEMGTDKLPYGCAAIGVSEVENAHCLDDLCKQEPLAKRGFKFVHIEGPDQRGVDCGLVYNPSQFKVLDYHLVPYVYIQPEDSLRATRGFFVVNGKLAGERLTIIVNHLPSRFAGSFYREEGGRQLRIVKDSILKAEPDTKIIIMGDMNDDPREASMSQALGAKREMEDVEDNGLYNPFWKIHDSGTGTLMYGGAWNLFDQIILSRNLLDVEGEKDYDSLTFFQAQIFRRDYLFQQEGKYKGGPLRTHAGGVWLDGYSDHLPTVVYLVKEKEDKAKKEKEDEDEDDD